MYDEGKGRERTWEVTAVEEAAGETLVTVSEVSADGKYPIEKVSVSARGVFSLETGPFKVEPVCQLRLPVKEGDRWEHHIPQRKGLLGQKGTVTVGPVEEVEVPAGKFKAVRVDTVITEQNGQPLAQPLKYTRWYDPELGVVKVTGRDGFTRVLK